MTTVHLHVDERPGKDAIEDRVHRKVEIVRVRERMNPLLEARIEQDAIYL